MVVIITKKLISMARKWQERTEAKRLVRVTWPKTRRVADKGHFVVYTTDGRRFMIPLLYLECEVIRELLRMAEEEFGVPSDGPITLPCDSGFMEYAMFLIKSQAVVDIKHSLLFLADFCCSSSA